MISSSFDEIKDIFDLTVKHENPENILGIFDIHFTLLAPKIPYLQKSYIEKHQNIFNKILSALSSIEQDITLALAYLLETKYLPDENIPYILNNLQRKGMRLIALSAAPSGTIENISLIEELLYTLLRAQNIEFSSSFPKLQQHTFTNLMPYRGTYPVFHKGILLSNGEKSKLTKGQVLYDFLKHTKYHPKVIIFIDDKHEHLKDVQKSLKNLNPNIRFIGIEYQGARKLEKNIEINKKKFLEFWSYWANKALKSKHKGEI